MASDCLAYRSSSQEFCILTRGSLLCITRSENHAEDYICILYLSLHLKKKIGTNNNHTHTKKNPWNACFALAWLYMMVTLQLASRKEWMLCQLQRLKQFWGETATIWRQKMSSVWFIPHTDTLHGNTCQHFLPGKQKRAKQQHRKMSNSSELCNPAALAGQVIPVSCYVHVSC